MDINSLINILVNGVTLLSVSVVAYVLYVKTPLGKIAEIDPEYYEDPRVASLASVGSFGIALFSIGLVLMSRLADHRITTLFDFIIFVSIFAFFGVLMTVGTIVAYKSLVRLSAIIPENQEQERSEEEK